MSLAHKVYSFLHVLFLECGPDIGLLRWRLSRIRGWCTDWGVESQVANTPDLLPDFLVAIGCRLMVAKETHLFPRAVWMPGWHHHWDNIVKHALSALPWWAMWLKELKTVVKFMRVESYRTELASQAKRGGFDARFTNLTPPNFAEWRWSTLFLTCAWLVPNIPVLNKIWSISLFAKAKVGAVTRAVNAGLDVGVLVASTPSRPRRNFSRSRMQGVGCGLSLPRGRTSTGQAGSLLDGWQAAT